METNSFYRNSKKSIEKLDDSKHFINIFDKSRNIFQIISGTLNYLLQLGCQAEPLFPHLPNTRKVLLEQHPDVEYHIHMIAHCAPIQPPASNQWRS